MTYEKHWYTNYNTEIYARKNLHNYQAVRMTDKFGRHIDIHKDDLEGLINCLTAAQSFLGSERKATDLRGANLDGVNLSRANLTGADLRGAYYNEKTNFDGAILDGVIWGEYKEKLDN